MFGNSPNCPPDRLLMATDMQPILAVMRSADARSWMAALPAVRRGTI